MRGLPLSPLPSARGARLIRMRSPSSVPPCRGLALGTSLTGLPALAQDAAAPMPDGVTHFTLPNGLETVVIQDERAPVVVQMVWYKIGAADEVPGKSGIAHYLEHLMFRRAPTRWSPESCPRR